jgi:hypothetical protein
MRALIGSAIAAAIAVTGLLGAITQAVVIKQYANGSTVAQLADGRTRALLVAREGDPTVYALSYVRRGVDNDLPSSPALNQVE